MKNSSKLAFFTLAGCLVLLASVRTNAQAVTGFTDVSYDDLTNTVTAYSETDTDYDVCGDYQAYVYLSVTDDTGNFLASGGHRDVEGYGYASVTFQFAGSPDTTYTGVGTHKVYANFYDDYWDYSYYPYSHIYDFYDNWYFGFFEGSGISYPWYYYFFSPGYGFRTRRNRYVTLGTTHSYDSATTPGVSIQITPSQTVNDGDTANLSLTVNGDTPNGYEWSFTAPRNAGNNPQVNFTAKTSRQTQVTAAHWFANPDDMCNAAINATYTIKCTVTLSNNKRKTVQTQLTVSAFNGEPGVTQGPSITGGPARGFDTNRGLYVVVSKGTMSRSAPVVTINIPSTSQFYQKAVAHENQHVANWAPGGVLGDLYIVDDLFALLSPLTDSTDQGLLNQINSTAISYFNNQDSLFNSRRRADEQAAYAASDPIGPQYLGMWRCQQSRYP